MLSPLVCKEVPSIGFRSFDFEELGRVEVFGPGSNVAPLFVRISKRHGPVTAWRLKRAVAERLDHRGPIHVLPAR
jgi:hypothetical protein